MAKTFKLIFKLAAWSLLVVLLFAGLMAAGAMMLGPWAPDGITTIHMGDEMITFSDGMSLGASHGVAIWLIITSALVVSFFAVVFALGVAALALFAVGLLLISPVLAVAAVVWLIVRLVTKRTYATPPAAAPAG